MMSFYFLFIKHLFHSTTVQRLNNIDNTLLQLLLKLTMDRKRNKTRQNRHYLIITLHTFDKSISNHTVYVYLNRTIRHFRNNFCDLFICAIDTKEEYSFPFKEDIYLWTMNILNTVNRWKQVRNVCVKLFNLPVL